MARAGFRADFPRENSDWTSHPVILLPSPLTGTEQILQHVRTNFWNKLRAYVSRGGVVFASVSSDAAIPEMEDLFGARLADHVSVGNVTLTVVSPLGDLRPGDKFSFEAGRQPGATLEVRGGTVVATDQDGRPALVASGRGAGKTLLCAYPLEMYLSGVSAAFDRDEPTHRIYRALLEWAGVHALFRTNQPSVEIGALKGDSRGYAILANHSGRTLPVVIDTTLPVRSLAQITPAGSQPLMHDGQKWKMDLGPYEGAIVEWTQ